MSGLPIMPALPLAPAFQREAAPQIQPLPGQTAATARTQTTLAVQQAPASRSAHSLLQQPLATPPDRRARLVGPPPTFEVNVLQDIQEARAAPPDLAGQDPAPDDVPKATAPPRAEMPGYAALLDLAKAEDLPEAPMDRSV